VSGTRRAGDERTVSDQITQLVFARRRGDQPLVEGR
jgi:hypothetical protein